MIILGIETSCDDTAVSLIEIDGESVRVLANSVHSQIDIHRPYGGVFPTLAKREHARNLVPVFAKTLSEAGLSQSGTTELPGTLDAMLSREPELLAAFKSLLPTLAKPAIDLIAVTQGPGLEPALWVGINFARALGDTWDIPVIPVNHMEGHVLVALLRKSESEKLKVKSESEKSSILNFQFSIPEFPALALLISGGHTEMVLMRGVGEYEIAGKTRDDAIGECFDKVARLMGLPYPGGPEISRLADEARRRSLESPFPLPRPMIDSPDLDFSFSGLKTAVRYALEEHGKLGPDEMRGLAREVEDAITEVIIAKLERALDMYAYQSLIAGGGVIANATIRQALADFAESHSLALYLPQVDHSTDNALMISIAGYFKYSKNHSVPADFPATGGLSISSK
ncbi:MAG: tRNA (adenosine(37)-N6)-threonylcarbamoyltransferase complex transferase subunit TsaD [Candidatus Paceibacterota bacterium]|jgi:N6-L-threonylcarbamoyladenine synthase